jgi:transposase
MVEDNTKVAGVDVGKAWLDAAVAGLPDQSRVGNDEVGWARLVTWLMDQGVGLVGMEATGGYERGLSAALREAGFRVRVLQPGQVRAFAVFRLQRAKTDRIDAGLIAQATAVSLGHDHTPDPRLEPQTEHLTLIEQIEEDLVRAKTRLESFRQPRQRQQVIAEIARLKAWRQSELKALMAELKALPDINRRLELALSVPGIGPRTALALILRMPELGAISREQAASLAGLAPFNRDSGKLKAARHIHGGRTRLRTSLYAAALPASFRWNPALIALYGRLTAKGKPHKLALVACARKLLIYVNTVLQRGQPWVSQSTAV